MAEQKTNTDAVVVLSTFSDQEVAQTIATKLVEEKLAACIQVSAKCTSTYRWQNELIQESAYAVTIKTTRKKMSALITQLNEMHPDEVPEILAVPVTAGIQSYLEWLYNEVN